MSGLWSRTRARHGGRLLVLLHGLGATADVWLRSETHLAHVWPGGWLTPDLLGHGRSPRSASYAFAAHAEAVSRTLPPDREVVVVGHSLGGMVGLALAATDPRVRRVLCVAVKTRWSDPELAAMRERSLRGSVLRDSRGEAAAGYLRASGLQGLVDEEDAVLGGGVRQTPAGWQLAQDPATYDFGTPDIAALLESTSCPVAMARGTRDPLVTDGDLGWVADRITLDGLGHHPHVEEPSSILRMLVGRL